MSEDTTTPTRRSQSGSHLLRRIWIDWLQPHWRAWALVLFFILIFSGANALYPEIIRRTVDALAQGDTSGLASLAGLIVAATLLKSGALYAQRIASNRAMTRVVYSLRTALFDHLIDADVAWLAREPPAALATRFSTDVGQVSGCISKLVTSALRDSLMIVGLLGALLYIDWELTLIAFAVFPIAIWPVIKIGSVLRKLTRRNSEQVARNMSVVTESFSAVRIAKTYGMERYLKGKAASGFDAIRELSMKRARHQSLIDPMMESLGGLAVAGITLLIGARIAAGTNTLGDVTGFIAALLLAAQPMRALGNLNATVQTGLAGAQRLYEVLDAPARVTETPGAPALKVSGGEIVFDDVSFRYGGETRAIADFSLTVPAGARVALVGRSGAGKTTVFNLLPRLYDPTEGRILIDGQDSRAVTLASLRASIALVAQEAALFNDTIGANIALGRPGASRDEIEAAARAAAAHDFIESMPGGYDAPVGERGERLSGGQRQRVSIARAFLRDAPILLLDEATSALDAESEAAIKRALDTLAKGRTTLIIAHRLSTVIDADLIAVMEAGRLVELGPHAELQAKGGAYARLHALQFKGALIPDPETGPASA